MIRKVFAFLAAVAWAFATVHAVPASSASTNAPEEMPALSEYGKLPGFEDAAISSSGTRQALLATVKDKRVIIIVDGGTAKLQYNIGEAKIRNLQWAGDHYLLVRKSETVRLGFDYIGDKGEFSSILVIPMDGSEPWHVFDQQRDIFNATIGNFGTRQIGDDMYVFLGGFELSREKVNSNIVTFGLKDGKRDLFRLNLRSRDAKMLSRNDDYNIGKDWLVGADGEISATMEVDQRSGKFVIRGVSGKNIIEGEAKYGASLVAFSQDGSKAIYYVNAENDERGKYLQVPLSGGQAEEIFPETRIAHFYTDRRTGRIVGYRQGDQAKTRYFFDPLLRKDMSKIGKAFPNLNVRLQDWTDNYRAVIARTDGNKDSGTWYKINLENLSAEAIGYERMKIGPNSVGPISTFPYTASDGLQMDGILTLPIGLKPENLPVIILPHGGPHNHDEEGFDWWAQAFASRGYAVFQPNFRGSTNRDAAFKRAGYGEWGRKMQTDISDGLAALADQGTVDPDRACIVGASYGGYAALAGVTLQQGLYRCAVSVNGVSDLKMMVSTDIKESGNNPMLKRSLERQVGAGSDLRDVSPRRFAEKADAPVLLIHGKDDVVVPFKQSAVMADALKDAGKPYEFVELDGEDHWLSRGETRLEMLKAAVAFIEKYNPPE